MPTISESLAGRAFILRLWPLSQAELAGESRTAPVIERWFEGDITGPMPHSTELTRQPSRDDYSGAVGTHHTSWWCR